MSHAISSTLIDDDQSCLRCIILCDGVQITYNKFVEGIRLDEQFRNVFFDFIATCEFDAVNWELPPVNQATFEQPFEFVLIENRPLATVEPNSAPFAEHYDNAGNGRGVVTFTNLRNDAKLVVPCPLDEPESYTHFAGFIREAPEDQVHALLEQVGHQIQRHLSEEWLWVSTAGMGVYWLHVRVSEVPKYYRHRGYASVSRLRSTS